MRYAVYFEQMLIIDYLDFHGEASLRDEVI